MMVRSGLIGMLASLNATLFAVGALASEAKVAGAPYNCVEKDKSLLNKDDVRLNQDLLLLEADLESHFGRHKQRLPRVKGELNHRSFHNKGKKLLSFRKRIDHMRLNRSKIDLFLSTTYHPTEERAHIFHELVTQQKRLIDASVHKYFLPAKAIKLARNKQRNEVQAREVERDEACAPVTQDEGCSNPSVEHDDEIGFPYGDENSEYFFNLWYADELERFLKESEADKMEFKGCVESYE